MKTFNFRELVDLEVWMLHYMKAKTTDRICPLCLDIYDEDGYICECDKEIAPRRAQEAP